MPYLDTAQAWLTQSTRLLQARPTTTRITTKYSIAHPDPTKKPKRQRRTPKIVPNSDAATPAEQAQNAAPRGTLTLKTYDPASGTTLKYRTTKGAEVSRLIQILGRVARPMCGLPEVKDEVG
ncbi:signal recognition particle 9 kDa protein-domain-containing protein, partial [Xylogone sp. PMI_703]